MTFAEKQQIIANVVAVLNQSLIIEPERTTPPRREDANNSVEMLSVRECAETIKGLSEHTVRNLIYKNKIPYVRAGNGDKGKILINKAALLDYLKKPT